jgi:5-formyltetrahydrofolate cyclo-ligase
MAGEWGWVGWGWAVDTYTAEVLVVRPAGDTADMVAGTVEDTEEVSAEGLVVDLVSVPVVAVDLEAAVVGGVGEGYEKLMMHALPQKHITRMTRDEIVTDTRNAFQYYAIDRENPKPELQKPQL